MATAATSLLGLALPVTGELSGTWGDTVNNSITSLVDSAIAGTTTISSDADVTLTTTTLAANTAREAILLWTASGTTTRNITAPAQSKAYIVINATGSTQSIVLRGAGPTTGVTIVAGEKALCAWNGSDFVKIATSVADGVTTITFGSTGLTPSTATSGAVTVAGTLAVANGGTGLTSGTSGGVLAYTAAGTLASSTALAASALVIGGGAGAAPSTTTTGTGVVTALGVNTGTAGAFVVNGGALGTPSSGTLTNATGLPLTTGVTGTLPIANGGTGATSQTAYAVLCGGTTSTGAYQSIAAIGSTGQVLTSNGAGALPTFQTAGGGVTISDDTATASAYYPTFATATSGSATTLKVSSTKLTYTPSTGTMSATVFSASSDERLKTNWRDVGSDFVEQLAGVKNGIFDRTDFASTEVGVGAQSLQKVLAEAVVAGEDGMLSVNYGGAAIVAAIKLAERVVALEARLAALEK